MVPGVHFSKHLTKDDVQLRQEVDGQLHDTNKRPKDVQHLSTSSISSSSDSNKTSPRTKKNDREINSDDLAATSKKTAKKNEDIVYNNKIEKEAELDNEMSDNYDKAEYHVTSPDVISETQQLVSFFFC